MQLPPLSVNAGAVAAQRPAASAALPGTPRRVGDPASGTARAEASWRGGLQRLDLQFNRQTAAMQQTLAFVDRSQNALSRLKADLSQTVADPGASADGVSAQLQRFAEHWATRVAATAGSLDGNLRLVGAGEARQQFSLHGLDEQTPQSTGQERLLFTVQGRAATPVVLEADLSPTATARRLDQALAPLGVRVAVSGQGDLQFSAAESDWPAVRDSLTVKGEGRLFPTGQFNRLRTTAEPERVRPQSWRVDDAQSARQTLGEVVKVGQRLQALASRLGEALNGLAGAPVAGESPDAARAAALAQGFSAQAQSGSFAALASVLPASLGLDRERVSALLALPAQG